MKISDKSLPLAARTRDFERKLPAQRITTQSLQVTAAKQKIEYMADFMGVGPSITAFATKIGIKEATLRGPANVGAFTPKLLKRIEDGLSLAGYVFSTNWKEWRDSAPANERADTLENFRARFHGENRKQTPNVRSAPASSNYVEAASHGVAPAIVPRSVVAVKAGLDLWTPGQMSETIFKQVCASVGQELAEEVRGLSLAAIEAIGNGDFVQQQAVAETAIELGRAHPATSLIGEGLYLKGEALRLQADFALTRDQQKALRKEAAQFYGLAEDALEGDPRAIRGQARITELAGDLDTSSTGYERALATIEKRLSNPNDGTHLSLVHERIRTLRHKIVCLADMQKDAPFSTLENQRRARQIRGYLERSEIDHSASLRLFGQFEAGHKHWLCVEWFASSALHAKGWAEIDASVQAAMRLITSLDARLRMIPIEGELSIVELGNLRWWARGARDVEGSFDPPQQAPLALLLNAIDTGAERSIIHRLGEDLILAGKPHGLPAKPSAA